MFITVARVGMRSKAKRRHKLFSTRFCLPKPFFSLQPDDDLALIWTADKAPEVERCFQKLIDQDVTFYLTKAGPRVGSVINATPRSEYEVSEGCKVYIKNEDLKTLLERGVVRLAVLPQFKILSKRPATAKEAATANTVALANRKGFD